ncbi:MAG TPA: SDR family oxidoreductase [Calditrichia bacterium]|nr:SDR family oxidoreductase [Calditrichota bacterium]HQU71652.1 SDR family oxidoreductase [Calditrichia bacterium]HQV31372.1 SDR family oxidoreductase [Calditrichia bacterium]
MFTTDTLSGKTILVTGGGSGLGLSMARHFARYGANVLICGRTEEKLVAATAAIGKENPAVKTGYYIADVREDEEVGSMISKIYADFGELNGLVNNAAGNFYCPSEDLSPNGFKTVVDIVLHGSFNCTRHFGKKLIDAGLPGAVLNIVTTYTESGSAFVLPSACAKAGVYAMTNSLAFEWATYGIRLNAIAPGPFPTEGAWKRLMPNPQVEQVYKQRQPGGRFGEPEELSHLAVFMMSDMAAYMTGECVTLDGGERLQGGQFNFVAQMMPREQLKAMFGAMRPGKKG